MRQTGGVSGSFSSAYNRLIYNDYFILWTSFVYAFEKSSTRLYGG